MRNTVLASLESQDGAQCVDFFVRPDGSFGFEQFRAEHDGSGRWQSLGRYSQLSFPSGEEAMQAAEEHIGWLGPSELWRW